MALIDEVKHQSELKEYSERSSCSKFERLGQAQRSNMVEQAFDCAEIRLWVLDVSPVPCQDKRNRVSYYTYTNDDYNYDNDKWRILPINDDRRAKQGCNNAHQRISTL
jgi:hypothetical protein